MTPSSWAWWRGRAVIFVKPIAFNSRLTVVSSSEIANISRIQPARSFSRQRTTPSTRRVRPRIDACPQRLALCIVELRHRTGRLAIDQAVRASALKCNTQSRIT